jgi:cold shock protein
MATGIVKWFNSRKGFGFITKDGEEAQDLFVHYSGIKDMGQYRVLNEGDKVEFEETEGQKGPQATEVVVTEAAPQQERRNNRY